MALQVQVERKLFLSQIQMIKKKKIIHKVLIYSSLQDLQFYTNYTNNYSTRYQTYFLLIQNEFKLLDNLMNNIFLHLPSFRSLKIVWIQSIWKLFLHEKINKSPPPLYPNI